MRHSTHAGPRSPAHRDTRHAQHVQTPPRPHNLSAGDSEILNFLLEDGEVTVLRSDDFGRTPLHDACWTVEPNFDVAACLLGKDRHLINVADSRKSLPLNYVNAEHWPAWCTFLHSVKDR